MIVRVLIILMLLVSQSAWAQNVPRPNIIIIVTDDQTYRAIGYENKIVQTPHLDSLARKGIIFRNAFTATPICVASRASLLTGRYPQEHNAIALNTSAFIDTIVKGKKYKTFPQHLQENGYTTFFCGKSHLGPPTDYGFNVGTESRDIKDSVAFQQVFTWINNDVIKQSPFLLWIGARQPHVPLLPDQEWLNKYPDSIIKVDPNFIEQPEKQSFFNQGLPGQLYFRDGDFINNYLELPAGPPRSAKVIQLFIKAYYATITHLDEQIGLLIDQLKNRELLNNTVFIFLSDNGYFLGNHGLGNKITMHEESVHIPFFIYPGSFNISSKEYDGLISTLDIFPTVLELAGISIPGNMPGRSLVPVIKGNGRPLHKAVFSECTGVGGGPGMGHRMVRTLNWKYIVSDIGEEALFNMKEDRFEKHNVINRRIYSLTIQQLKKQMETWKQSTDQLK